jgi:NADPH2:quinone reductase
VQKDDVVLVHGASGGVGLAAVHVAKLLGAFVIATGGSAEKLAVVREQGADHTIVVPPGGGFRDEVKALTSGRGVDVVYDPVGGDLFDESMRCITWGARLLVIGFTGGRPATARTNQLLIKGASVIGIRAGEIGRQVPGTVERNMAILLGWVADGRLKPHVSHRFAFSRAGEALQAVTDRKVVGKAVLIPD